MRNDLNSRVVLITGGDSGIGRAVALAFAREGARIAIVYYDEQEDALATLKEIGDLGAEGIAIAGDISKPVFCREAIEKTVEKYGTLDILVNNAGVQFPGENIAQLEEQHITRTIEVNILGLIFMVRAALPHLKKGSCIINTTSVTAYQGHPQLVDYAATKGAIVSFTRALALQLKEKGIRVNAVAPGAVVTPLTKATFGNKDVDKSVDPLLRDALPEEIAPSFVFLASEGAACMTGQVLHPNGGLIVNG